MKEKKQFSPGMNVGSSSILVTFVLLCLVTFAALSFVSANADHILAEKTGERIQAYYAGDSAAEINLANIDGQLTMFAANSDESDFYNGIEKLFSDNDLYTVTKQDDDVMIHYEIPVTETQILSVTLKAVYPKDLNDCAFEIKEWQNYTVYVPSEETIEEEKGGLLF